MEETCNMDAYVNFFARLAKYPFAVETMIKLGRPTARWLYSFTEGGASTYGIINWRGKNIKKLFRYSLTKEEKAWLRDTENTEIYCGELFQIWQWLRKRGNWLPGSIGLVKKVVKSAVKKVVKKVVKLDVKMARWK